MDQPFDKAKFFQQLQTAAVLSTNDTALTAEMLLLADRVWEQHEGDQKLRAAKHGSPDGRRYSDRWEAQGHQVIDLVQQGGGMLGIALVGYTYILEKAGLRFMSLAGTSAGGINTSLIATLPDSIYDTPDSTKSEILAHIIANTQFSQFIDRKGIVSRFVA